MSEKVLGRLRNVKRVADGWMASCSHPGHKHGDRNRSLHVSEGTAGETLLTCFAGHTAEQIVAAMGLELADLFPEGSRRGRRATFWNPGQQPAPAGNDVAVRRAANQTPARQIWARAQLAAGTPVERYFKIHRGITIEIPRHQSGPSSAVMHRRTPGPGLSWWPRSRPTLRSLGFTGPTCEAMDARPPWTPRRWPWDLSPAPPYGLRQPVRPWWSLRRIKPPYRCQQALGLPAWAALGTSNLSKLTLPGIVKEVVIAADGDEPGRKAASEAAQVYLRQGRRVRIMEPPEGRDFNDLLREEVINA